MGLKQQDGACNRQAEDDIAAAAVAVNQYPGQKVAGKMGQGIHAHHPADEGRSRPQ